MKSAQPPRPASSVRLSDLRFRTRIPLALAEVRRESLIRRLALDRLRDLHDDGVTTDYIGRMYGVSGARMRAVEEELRS
ncbi:MAG: hypothetical protein WD766_06830 [Gemmatimonadota bacterium]